MKQDKHYYFEIFTFWRGIGLVCYNQILAWFAAGILCVPVLGAYLIDKTEINNNDSAWHALWYRKIHLRQDSREAKKLVDADASTFEESSTMEFLMTYGWAILVVIIAIATLAYFGVLSPDRFLPEKCTLPSGVACLDFTGTQNMITLVIQNRARFDMQHLSIAIQGIPNMNCTPDNMNLLEGDKETFTCYPTGVVLDDYRKKYKGSIIVNYINSQSGLPEWKTGEIILRR